jgi:hypothetical protein
MFVLLEWKSKYKIYSEPTASFHFCYQSRLFTLSSKLLGTVHHATMTVPRSTFPRLPQFILHLPSPFFSILFGSMRYNEGTVVAKFLLLRIVTSNGISLPKIITRRYEVANAKTSKF